MKFPDPVISVAVEPKTAGDQQKLSAALSRLARDDQYFQVTTDDEGAETVIGGTDERHLESIIKRLESDFEVGVKVGAPQVAYRETITRPVEVDYTHKIQEGGAGQFARVKVKFQPHGQGAGLEFESAVADGSVSKEDVAGVEQGLLSAAMNGVLIGFPITDMKMTLTDGETHGVDSSVRAFEAAGRAALREGVAKAGPKVLEPVMRVEVVTPEECLDDIIGDLNSRRGTIYEVDRRGDMRVINAKVPAANMFNYVNNLRSMSQGLADFTMHFDHYEKVPDL